MTILLNKKTAYLLELYKMHILQPKHSKLKKEEISRILEKYNISLMQLPRIKLGDPAIPQESEVGDVFKIERKEGDKTAEYFRVVVA